MTAVASVPFTTFQGALNTSLRDIYAQAGSVLATAGRDIRLESVARCYVNGGIAYVPFTGVVRANATSLVDAARAALGPTASVELTAPSGGGTLSVSVVHLFAKPSTAANAAPLRQRRPINCFMLFKLLLWIVAVVLIIVIIRTSSSSSSSSTSNHGGPSSYRGSGRRGDL